MDGTLWVHDLFYLLRKITALKLIHGWAFVFLSVSLSFKFVLKF